MRTRFRNDEEMIGSRYFLAKEAQSGWMTLLEPIEWNWFLTVTFKMPRKDSYLALKAVTRELETYDPQHYFVGTELHRSGDVHCHGLISFDPESSWALDSWRLWAGLFDRFGRSEVVRPIAIANVVEYVTKYCTKDLTDWHMLGFNGSRESLTGGDYAQDSGSGATGSRSYARPSGQDASAERPRLG